MIREYTTTERERGITKAQIEICTKNCPFPARKCNGECAYYKAQSKLIRQTKQLKKKVIVF